MSKTDKKFDLEERTAEFGENIICFVKTVDKNDTNSVLIKQVVRSATSIGANYMEANGAESKRDFIHKIHICMKESKETMHWLRMIAHSNKRDDDEVKRLWQEAKELTLIFGKICSCKK